MKYKVRRTKYEIKDESELLDIIKKAEICRMALCDGDVPYVIPLNFGHKDKTIYFHCATSGRKLDIIAKNNKVCLEFEDEYQIIQKEVACNWTCHYRSVIAYGQALLVSDDDEKIYALKILMSQYSDGQFDFSKKQIDRVAIIKVPIDSMTGKYLSD